MTNINFKRLIFNSIAESTANNSTVTSLAFLILALSTFITRKCFIISAKVRQRSEKNFYLMRFESQYVDISRSDDSFIGTCFKNIRLSKVRAFLLDSFHEFPLFHHERIFI